MEKKMFIRHPSKTILITGAAGFIGAHLCRRILPDDPDASIIAIDNLNDYYDVRLKYHRLSWFLHCRNFLFRKGDIADKGFVHHIFAKYKPDLVINLAAQAGVRYSIANPDAFVSSNIVGFFNILEACRIHHVKHLVYASSSSVYGNINDSPFSTLDNTDFPLSLYAATKKSDELMAHAYSSLYGIPSTGLRFFTVYGPAGRPDMAYFSFAEKLRHGENISLFNHGDLMRDFTYIDDIVEAIVRVMLKPPNKAVADDGYDIPPYAVYNVGNGHPVSILDFLDILCQELVRAGVLPPDFNHHPLLDLVPMQPGDVLNTCADVSALVNDCAFKPATGLRHGLRQFAEWYHQYCLTPKN